MSSRFDVCGGGAVGGTDGVLHGTDEARRQGKARHPHTNKQKKAFDSHAERCAEKSRTLLNSMKCPTGTNMSVPPTKIEDYFR